MGSDGAYSAFRHDGGPTLYGPLKLPVLADILEAGFIFAAVILALSFILVIPGVRGSQVSKYIYFQYLVLSKKFNTLVNNLLLYN